MVTRVTGVPVEWPDLKARREVVAKREKRMTLARKENRYLVHTKAPLVIIDQSIRIQLTGIVVDFGKKNTLKKRPSKEKKHIFSKKTPTLPQKALLEQKKNTQ